MQRHIVPAAGFTPIDEVLLYNGVRNGAQPDSYVGAELPSGHAEEERGGHEKTHPVTGIQ